MVKLKIESKTYSPCLDFLYIKWPDDDFLLVQDFMKIHSGERLDKYDLCEIKYRNEVFSFSEHRKTNSQIISNLPLYNIKINQHYHERNKYAYKFYIEKAAEYLTNARYFFIKLLPCFDPYFSLGYNPSYVGYYWSRCLSFSSSVSWLANSFDQILQSVYWNYKLYENAIDHDNNKFDESWTEEKIMKFCKLDFVLKELEDKCLGSIRSLLVSTSNHNQEIWKWSNYLKHKGGFDFQYLNPPPVSATYVLPKNYDNLPGATIIPDDKYRIDNFLSPIKIDIDKDYVKLQESYKTLLNCCESIFKLINDNEEEL